ncbi:related to TFIIH basal transcription factor complex p34 subunit [Serendipita indica DSM 11827]|uniref:General transcription and DNA repair factor IIH subunit TFB4 n=1 Tax=Serendipita indica (strain DSM 11827) TaxID=1109443 RepID=G4TL22_SERID|nr:related to TFIIH basal transcription factor complex p34 subunit [Serendipita indica DSM 11827]
MENASHLSVILDLSPSQWYQSSQTSGDKHPLSLAHFLPQLFVFLNAHLASQHENTLTVFGAFPGKSSMLYSSNETYIQADADSNTFQPFKTMNSVIAQRLNEELESLPEDAEAPIALVGALTKSLCTINRRSHPSDTLNATSPNPSKLPTPRLLVISVSPDLSASYIPIMNSIFCAQKLKLSIDVCKIFGPDNVFLQQAAHLTGGSYISIDRRDSILQYLMTTFLSPPAVRRLMAVPTEDRIDLRAACFCHKQIVDIGFICSICLSIFCKPTPVCSTCRVKFPIKTLQRLKEAVNPVLPPNIPAPKLPAEAPPATPRVMPPFSMPHPGFMPAGLFTPKKMSKIPKPAPRVPPGMK